MIIYYFPKVIDYWLL